MCIHNNTASSNPQKCYECFNEIFNEMTYTQIINHYRKFKKSKKFDADKVFAETVKFYMDKKGYTKDQANDIARKVVEQ